MEYKMKKLFILSVMIALVGCTEETQSLAERVKKSSNKASMANPASAYCIDLGGKLEIVKESDGDVGYCTLPSGEVVEEWQLYRQDRNNN